MPAQEFDAFRTSSFQNLLEPNVGHFTAARTPVRSHGP